MRRALVVLLAGAVSAAAPAAGPDRARVPWDIDPFPSTYRPAPSGMIAIVGATILTASGPLIANGTVIVRDNHIVAVGQELAVPQGARIIDARGKWVTPGIVDAHTHLGGISIPYQTLADGLNELTDPNTAELYVEHSLWPQSPAFSRILAAGVTTVQVLPGSSNIFAGRTVVLKPVPAVTITAMKFPGAPYGLKMTCGENPTRVYGPQGRAPMTRAELIARIRGGFAGAQSYRRKWRNYAAALASGKSADPPDRDLKLDTLAGALDGSIRVNVHCYRADDMDNVMAAAAEFDVRITSFHHATEAFKIIPLLRDRGPCILTWGGPDWGGFKAEAEDHTALEVAMLDRAGMCVAVTSDSAETGQHLQTDAARAMAAGRRAGLAVAPADAIRWITINPARALGVDKSTGSLEPGKMADIVIWSGNPFSVYAHPEAVLVDGIELFRFDVPGARATSDADLGRLPAERRR